MATHQKESHLAEREKILLSEENRIATSRMAKLQELNGFAKRKRMKLMKDSYTQMIV